MRCTGSINRAKFRITSIPLRFYVTPANFKSSLLEIPFIFSFQNLTVRYFSTVEDSPVEASPSPYLGIFKIPKTRASKRGYQIPKSGHIQLVINNFAQFIPTLAFRLYSTQKEVWLESFQYHTITLKCRLHQKLYFDNE